MDDSETLKTELIRESVKVHALQNGLLDASDLNNLALDGITRADDGTITGVSEFVSRLRVSKSHWFKQDNKSATHDRAGRQIPKPADVSGIKPGGPEHKKLESDYKTRWNR